MEKKKYKSVPVTDMTIWQLGQAVADGGEFYDIEGSKLYISRSHDLCSERWTQSAIATMLENKEITTRQPLPWYEVEGVFPCLVKRNEGEFFCFLCTGVESGFLKGSEMNDCVYDASEFSPLTPSEATEYGVE